MKVKVQEVTQKPTKTGKQRWIVNPGASEQFTVWNETTAKILAERKGQEIEAQVKEDKFGKKITRVNPAQTSTPPKAPPAADTFETDLEKREQLSAKQTALNAAVAVASAKVTAGLASPSSEDVKQVARQYYKWLLTDEE